MRSKDGRFKKGHKHSAEIILKNRLAHLGQIPWNKGKKGVMPKPWNKGKKTGHIPWNKGKKGVQVAWNKGKKTGQIPWNKDNPEASKRMIGTKNPFYGKKHSEEANEKNRLAHLGKSGWLKGKFGYHNHGSFKKGHKHSEATRSKISQTKQANPQVGSKNPFYGKKHSEELQKRITAKIKEYYGTPKGRATRLQTSLRMVALYDQDTPKGRAMRDRLREARLHQVIPSKDTKIEKTLQNKLQKNGIEFEKHIPILGQPDIFIEPNICIFADGDYWHGWLYLQGKDFSKQKKFNNDYFENRISRDVMVAEQLKEEGYTVRRFWEHEIKENPEKCLQDIIKIIKKARKQTST